MAEDLTGRTALVTGATAGLGRVIAEHLATCGAHVAVHGRSADSAAAVVGAITSAGGSAIAVTGDLLDIATPESIVAQVSDVWGAIDLLVNNAADQQMTPLATTSTEQWRSLLQVNLLATVDLTRLVCAGVANPAEVAVVNVGSVEGLAPFPGHAAYAASKAALASFTASAALEWSPARVNGVAPGLIAREGLADAWPVGLHWWQQVTPAGRPVDALEVAAAVAFLASSSASGITGVTLPVDGGWASAARASWGRPPE